MCDAFEEYPQFIATEDIVDKTSCSTIKNGILKKGF